MKRFYCTYFDKAYLVRGLTLHASLLARERNDFTLYIVCLDEITRVLLKKLNLRNVELIPLHEIEQNDFELLNAKKNRSLVEYYWTLTPTVILRIIERYSEIDLLTYLDSDMMFFSSPDPIFEEFADNSVLIHAHRFPPQYMQLAVHGTYNVGLLCFRKDQRGLEVLLWWRARCNEWCYARVEDGKYGDQLYLEDWPERFAGVHVLQHVGAGLAPWNVIQYTLSRSDDGAILVDDKPLVFYHFHAFEFFSSEVFVLAKHGYPLAENVLKYCYFPYVLKLLEKIALIQMHLPSFTFGLNNSNTIRDENAFIAPKEAIKQLGIKGRIIDLDDSFVCCCLNQVY